MVQRLGDTNFIALVARWSIVPLHSCYSAPRYIEIIIRPKKWAAPRHERSIHKRVVPQNIADGDNTVT